jgi:hypothetical protein
MSWLSWFHGRGDLRVKIDYTFSELDDDGRFTVTDNVRKKKLRFAPSMHDQATGVVHLQFLTPDDGNDQYELQLYEKDGDDYVDVVRPEDLPVGPITALLMAMFELERPNGEASYD